MTRLVLDTNVVISGLLFHGEAARLADAWQRRDFRLAVTPDILNEYIRVLAYPKFGLPDSDIEAIAGRYLLPHCDVFEEVRGARVCPDRDDDKFLYCAVAASAAAIVSGDSDILGTGGKFNGIPILTLRAALRRYGRPMSSRGGRRTPGQKGR